MINRDQIEKILKINGVSAAAPDEQIRSVLLSARYRDEEVDTAIMVLREDINTKKTRVEGLHKVFRSDQALDSKEIAQLLGIEVDISDRIAAREIREKNSFTYHLILWILSVAVATGSILFYMNLHSVGLYHPTVSGGR